ncbi:serine hydrolase [Flavobacteriales bacterium AH-315-E23]|nr:serine hydrolase [Flavobacteriales bacterium AH-315-E23]
MRIILIILIITVSSSCTYVRIIHRNFPNITDYKLFPQKVIHRAEKEFVFHTRAESMALPNQNEWGFYRGGKRITNSKVSLDKYLERSNTTALIIIRNDSILYEQYFNGYKRDRKSLNFSITKAILSTLTAIAVKEDAFESFDQEIGDFIPMYAGDKRGKVTIGNLVDMNTGFDCNDYGQQMRFIRLYYSKHPQKFMKRRKLKHDPGSHHAYSSFTSMLLGICLEKATGKALSQYMEEKLWKKLGTSFDASISTFQDGTPMAWGGLTSYPIDLVKFARLVLNRGRWGKEEIIPEQYIDACKDRSEGEGKVWRYSKGFWLDTYNCLKEEEIAKLNFKEQKRYCEDEEQVYAGGYRGQILFIDFEKQLIILRLGTGNGNRNWSRSISKLATLL